MQALRDNLQAPMPELARMFPGKSESAVRGAARRLGRKRIIRQGYSMSNGYKTRYKGGRHSTTALPWGSRWAASSSKNKWCTT